MTIAAIRSLYEEAFPTRLERTRRIGIEEEFAVVKPDGTMGNIMPIFPILVAGGWYPKRDAITEALVCVQQDGVEVSTDVGIGVLEVSYPPAMTLFDHDRLAKLVLISVDHALATLNLKRLTDYSAQPVTVPLPEHWAPKARYAVFRDRLPPAVHNQTASAGSQIHMDMARGEVLPAMEVFLSLAGVFIALTANSPVWGGALDPENMLASRVRFWDRFTLNHGYWSNVRVGLPPTHDAEIGRSPRSFDELARFAAYTNFLVGVQDGAVIAPLMPFEAWCKRQNGALEGDGFRNAFLDHETTMWWEARPRIRYSTLEFRPCCQNSNTLAHHALALGLMEELEEALSYVRMVNSYSGWRRLRDRALVRGMGTPAIDAIAHNVLRMATDGLRGRGFGEETLLEPIRHRIADKQSPAFSKVSAFDADGLPGLLNLILS
ncbi:MAG: glutamate-cysteine ligase family protein [bacterium]|nr:glutamate-cysteine ligase family protein [bacterium]